VCGCLFCGSKATIGAYRNALERSLPEMTFPQLTHPPLREALVDIRLRDELPLTWMEKLENLDFDGFVYVHPMKHGQFKFEISRDQPARAEVTADQPLGRRYDKKDGTQVLQVRRNGMTLSILKNYTNWDALRDAARDKWNKYLDISGPVGVSRLALRYINGIEMPFGVDYDDYLTAGPRIPGPLPQMVNNFIQRVEVPFEKDNATAIITQALEMPVADKRAAVLDIDVFSLCSLGGTSSEVWSVLERLRIIANDIFFSSVTKKVIESYL